jgi:hypothetical protein
MHSKLTYSTILLVATFVVARVGAQTTPATKTVLFRDPLRAHVESIPEPPPILQQLSVRLSGALSGQFPDASIRFVLSLENKGPRNRFQMREQKAIELGMVTLRQDGLRSIFAGEPPPALQQLSVELSGALAGRLPNLSIQFILSLQNNGPQEVKILDPLDTLSFNFSTIGKRPIDVPERIPKIVLDTFGDKRDLPFPAHVRFRRIARGTMASYEKEEVVTIPPGGKMQIEFETEPIIMEKVMEALRAETGEDAKSFRAEAFLALLNDPPQPGGRSVYSDPILFTLPAPYHSRHGSTANTQNIGAPEVRHVCSLVLTEASQAPAERHVWRARKKDIPLHWSYW